MLKQEEMQRKIQEHNEQDEKNKGQTFDKQINTPPKLCEGHQPTHKMIKKK